MLSIPNLFCIGVPFACELRYIGYSVLFYFLGQFLLDALHTRSNL